MFSKFTLVLIFTAILLSARAEAQRYLVSENDSWGFTQQNEKMDYFENAFPILGGGYDTVFGPNVYFGIIHNTFGKNSPGYFGWFFEFTGSVVGGKFRTGLAFHRALGVRAGFSAFSTNRHAPSGTVPFSNYVGGDISIHYKLFNLIGGFYQNITTLDGLGLLTFGIRVGL